MGDIVVAAVAGTIVTVGLVMLGIGLAAGLLVGWFF